MKTHCQSISILRLCALTVAVVSAPARAVDVWLTTGDKSKLLAQQTDIVFQPGAGSGGTPISVVPTTTFQTISGFGAAMTDSSAWLLQNDLTVDQRDKLMRQLFSPTGGIGMNYLRVPLGASDFTASGFYSYNDNPTGGTDESQGQFSIAHDQAYIVPRLQQALALNPDLKLMATPWSAPGWMKTNNSLVGGSLKPQWEESYALYLKKSVDAYLAEGLPFDALTLQNEPLNTSNYPTMYMSATQQTNIIEDYLGPLFTEAGISTKVLAYDHNWDNIDYPLQVLDDPAARQYVAGTAFHAYAGSVTAQTAVHEQHPDKDIYFSEITGGDWGTNFADNLVWSFRNILNGSVRNWAKTALYWNLVLDQNGGPHQGGCSGCRGIVTVNTASGAVSFSEEFYALGQVTKAVRPNAVRVASTTYPNGMDTVAYTNPDGSQALVAMNPGSSTSTIRVVFGGKHFSYQIPGRSVATFLWDSEGADFDNGGFDEGAYESGGGSLDAWTSFGNTIGNVSVADEAVQAGDKSLKLYGQFSEGENTSGVFQGITVSPGDYVSGSVMSLVRSADSILGTNNLATMKIEFYGTYGASYGSADFLGVFMTTIVDGSSPNDVWVEHQLGGLVPADAVEARLVLQFLQPNGEAGAIHLDSVTFGTTEVAPPTADFDRDGDVDSDDLTIWQEAFDTRDGADADADGDTDGADFLIWQRQFHRAVIMHEASQALSEPTIGVLFVGMTIALLCGRSSSPCIRTSASLRFFPMMMISERGMESSILSSTDTSRGQEGVSPGRTSGAPATATDLLRRGSDCPD